MKVYTTDDQVTFYFIISEHSSGNQVKAWTDNKILAEFYMEFHSCKRHRLKTVKKKFRDIVPILNENTNDEIEIVNLVTKSDNKKDDGYKIIQVPATTTEMSIIRDSQSTSCSTIVNYSNINKFITLFKKKYQKAFNDIGLTDVIKQELYSKSSKFTENIQLDGLRLLFRLFKEDFD